MLIYNYRIRSNGTFHLNKQNNVSRKISRRTKWKMNKIIILTYGLDLALKNKYLEVIIKSLKPKLFNEVFKTVFHAFQI